jgi:hypothetical protein
MHGQRNLKKNVNCQHYKSTVHGFAVRNESAETGSGWRSNKTCLSAPLRPRQYGCYVMISCHTASRFAYVSGPVRFPVSRSEQITRYHTNLIHTQDVGRQQSSHILRPAHIYNHTQQPPTLRLCSASWGWASNARKMSRLRTSIKRKVKCVSSWYCLLRNMSRW